jgi:hypothetical protein
MSWTRSFDLATLMVLPLSLWMGWTGKVDWWTVMLIWAVSRIRIEFTWNS